MSACDRIQGRQADSPLPQVSRVTWRRPSRMLGHSGLIQGGGRRGGIGGRSPPWQRPLPARRSAGPPVRRAQAQMLLNGPPPREGVVLLVRCR